MSRFKDYIPWSNSSNAISVQPGLALIGQTATLAFVATVDGVTAITVNGHASEVHACTLDDQTKMMDEAADEVGAQLPLICGVYADGSHIAANIARMADAMESALLCFPPGAMGMGGIRHPLKWELPTSKHRGCYRFTDNSFSVQLAYPLDTLVQICEDVPTVRAIKDWSPPQLHERHIKTLHGLSRPVNVLSTTLHGLCHHSLWGRMDIRGWLGYCRLTGCTISCC